MRVGITNSSVQVATTMSDQADSSVSNWLRPFEDGDSDASRKLFDEYFEKLIRHAEKRLRHVPPGVTEAEDVASSVFKSLWRGASNGRFKDVRNRDELWWLLVALTQRKIATHIRRESAQKRNGARSPESLSDDRGIAGGALQVASAEPSVEDLVTFDDEFQRLLKILPDDRLPSLHAENQRRAHALSCARSAV